MKKKSQGLWDGDRKKPYGGHSPPVVRHMKAPGTTFIDKGLDPYH